jgi:phosphomannomutase / phosphoglucomutase
MPRLFGTNGVRGIVGKTMTQDLALSLGRAIGMWLVEDKPWPVQGQRPCVVIARDARDSGQMLQAATTAGLLAMGCDVLDAGVAPTPAVQYAVKTEARADAGVIITASHNPPEFNGIKVCRQDGREAEPELEELIEARFFSGEVKQAPWDQQGGVMPLEGVCERYEDAIARLVDVEAIKKARPTVVVDTANGAASVSMPRLLGRLGCRVISLNAHPDGAFPGHPSEPTPEHAGDASALVQRHKALCGVMVDGDGDRSVFLDEEGSFVPGEKTLAVLAADAVRKQGGGTVCTPVSSSSVVELAVKEAGGVTHYTVVGSPKVARAMVDSEGVLGGEENGGIMFPEHQYTRDAGITAARLVELLVVSGKPLSKWVKQLPERTMVKRKVVLEEAAEMEGLVQGFARVAQSGQLPGGRKKVRVDDRDGVKLYMEDCWVLVRKSGTEPLVRIYAEAKTEQQADALAEDFQQVLLALKEKASA